MTNKYNYIIIIIATKTVTNYDRVYFFQETHVNFI